MNEIEKTASSRKPTAFAELSPQQQLAHRERIGFRAKSILGGFWTDTKISDTIQAFELESWMDVLQDCSHREIAEAWGVYEKAGPRTERGKLYKPDAGYLWRVVMAARANGWPEGDPGEFCRSIFEPADQEVENARARLRQITAEALAAGRRN